MTSQEKKIILIEFNELVPSLVERFISEGHLPNFEKLASQSNQFITDANQEGEDLNPWIQWVTVHTGLTPKEHGVYRLNEAHNCNGKYMWDKLSLQGKSSLIFGSMNGCKQDSFLGTYLPDPWDKSTAPSKNLEVYFEFIRAYVQGNPSSSKVRPFQFIKFMLANGLTLKTSFKIVKQLVCEKIDSNQKWKRAGLLDWIQLDVFKSLLKKEKPTLATFFSNSTAHIQHHYWMESFPEQFNFKVEKKMAENPMLLSYKNHDAILGEILKLKDENTSVAFCTALSQQPYTKNVKYFYHINEFEAFAETISLPGNPKYIPVMAEQFYLKFENETAVHKAFEHLSKFVMPSNEYFYEGSNKVFSMSIEESTLHIKCRCTKLVPQGTKFVNNETEELFDFYELFYQMDDLKTGIHHPYGLLWITSDSKGIADSILPLEEAHNKIMAEVS